MAPVKQDQLALHTGEVMAMFEGQDEDDIVVGNWRNRVNVVGRMSESGGGDPNDFDQLPINETLLTQEDVEDSDLFAGDDDETPAPFSPVQDVFPVLRNALAYFKSAERKPRVVRIDTDDTYEDFIGEVAVRELGRRVADLRVHKRNSNAHGMAKIRSKQAGSQAASDSQTVVLAANLKSIAQQIVTLTNTMSNTMAHAPGVTTSAGAAAAAVAVFEGNNLTRLGNLLNNLSSVAKKLAPSISAGVEQSLVRYRQITAQARSPNYSAVYSALQAIMGYSLMLINGSIKIAGDVDLYGQDILGAARAVKKIAEAKTAGEAAQALPSVPVDVPPFAEGKIRCWKDGDNVVCSMRFESAGGTRVATMAAKPKVDAQSIVGWAQRAGVHPVTVLGVASDLADVVMGKRLVRDVAGAALAAHRRMDVCGMDGDEDAEPLLLSSPGEEDETATPRAALAHVQKRAHAGDRQAKKEMSIIERIAVTAAGRKVVLPVLNAVRELAGKSTVLGGEVMRGTFMDRYVEMGAWL